MHKTLKKLEEVVQQAFEDYKAAESKTCKTLLLQAAVKAHVMRFKLLKELGILPDNKGH